jgi:hypothetical protein
MANISKFESRVANLSCSPEKFYTFITDIRNFGEFIPLETMKGWKATEDTCSFNISPLGDITLGVELKMPFTRVVFKGNALMTNDFSIIVLVDENHQNTADVKLVLEAELNPILSGMAAGPVQRFLEVIVSEMEKFTRWET